MFEVYDTFNNKVISRHRSLVAAVKANESFQAKVSKANGAGSYIPTVYHQDGKPVLPEDLDEAEYTVYCE